MAFAVKQFGGWEMGSDQEVYDKTGLAGQVGTWIDPPHGFEKYILRMQSDNPVKWWHSAYVTASDEIVFGFYVYWTNVTPDGPITFFEAYTESGGVDLTLNLLTTGDIQLLTAAGASAGASGTTSKNFVPKDSRARWRRLAAACRVIP